MQETKHTPGPWGVDNSTAGYGIPGNSRDMWVRVYAEDPGPELDFTVGFSRDADPARKNANARLMAAAPELLEALEKLTEYCSAYVVEWDELGNQCMDIARAAIARAKGVERG